ncbi:MAG TPA: hypothetical protein VIE44_06775 [Methylomirabilota bacterium]
MLLGAAGGLLLARVLAWPATSETVPADPQAGLRVQAMLAQLLLREAGLSSRREPLALTDAEVNAFLAQNVQVRDAPIWPVRVRIEAGGVEVGGPTTLERLTRQLIGSGPAGLLPRSVGGRPVWVAARGRIEVAPGGRTEFQAESGTIGLQTVPVALLWRAVGGRPPALVWRMPRVVDRVELEPGRLVIRTRRARPRGPTG